MMEEDEPSRRTSIIKINGLLLAGGFSTRMGRPKHLLKLGNGRFVYERLLQILKIALPEAGRVYLSVKKNVSSDYSLSVRDFDLSFETIYDTQEHGEDDIGPAAGLLTAHRADPRSHWLVLACDYPLMSSEELTRLVSSYTAPVTCMCNDEGFLEPLVAVWSPEALNRLAENVAKGQTGPNRTIRELGGTSISPLHEESLLNTNTPKEWEKAMGIFVRRGNTDTSL